ncbi:hypothetical protein [Streptomyces canus]|uniref:hypothetical protein n=1 Tax=Streptomyces canus TaxID=58343 RepID=UPI002787E4E8|nr:hypothetical protein [Streptomyces canus]MDQ0766885.1 flavin-dependent dehydrogenase [Streptomyces canus]MDQ1064913.1 flavin-dependent dehydrogenase [Streptomyces canus]
MTSTGSEQALPTDVLVIGGPAGTWAALKAVQAAADVAFADKGYTSARGATASVGTGIRYVDDVPELREAAIRGPVIDTGNRQNVIGSSETMARTVNAFADKVVPLIEEAS